MRQRGRDEIFREVSGLFWLEEREGRGKGLFVLLKKGKGRVPARYLSTLPRFWWGWISFS